MEIPGHRSAISARGVPDHRSAISACRAEGAVCSRSQVF